MSPRWKELLVIFFHEILRYVDDVNWRNGQLFFNVFHMSHSSVEGGTGKISDWIIGVNTLNEHFWYGFLMCKKYLFTW